MNSSIVRLIPLPEAQIDIGDPHAFAELVRRAFSQRRKTLRNNLKGMLSGEQIEVLGIDPGTRPETLDGSAPHKMSASGSTCD